MIARRSSGNDSSPPPERGRSASKARRVGVMQPSRFDRTGLKTLRARNLRRNFTDVEMKVWQKLRNRQLGVDFRRQHPAGSYVLDFYAPSVRLAVELDGEQHAQATTIASDRSRTRWLEERGVTMLRFWNSDVVQNVPGVLEVIAAKVAELQLSGMTPTRRWRADLPLSGRGKERRGPQ
jgi:very-short-patch-repair endonuclease